MKTWIKQAIGIVVIALFILTPIAIAIITESPSADKELVQQLEQSTKELEEEKARTTQLRELNTRSDSTQENIERLLSLVETSDDLMYRFKELSDKNQLSTSELLRYRTLVSEISHAPLKTTQKAEELVTLEKRSQLEKSEIQEFMEVQDNLSIALPASVLNYNKYGDVIITDQSDLDLLMQRELNYLIEESFDSMLEDVSNLNDFLNE